MSNPAVRQDLLLNVTVPANTGLTTLSALRKELERIHQLERELTAFAGKPVALAPKVNAAAFKSEIEKALREAFGNLKVKDVPVLDLASKILPKEQMEYLRANFAKLRADMDSLFHGRGVPTVPKAAQFFEGVNSAFRRSSAQSTGDRQAAVKQAAEGGVGILKGGDIRLELAPGQDKLRLEIPPSRIEVVLLDGQLKVNVPAGSAERGTGSGNQNAAGQFTEGNTASRRKGKKSGPSLAAPKEVEESGDEIRRQIREVGDEGFQTMVERQLDALTTLKTVYDEEGEKQSSVTTESVRTAAREKIRAELARQKAAVAQKLTGNKATDATLLPGLMETMAAHVTDQIPKGEGAEARRRVLGDSFVAGLEKTAAEIRARGQAAQQRLADAQKKRDDDLANAMADGAQRSRSGQLKMQQQADLYGRVLPEREAEKKRKRQEAEEITVGRLDNRFEQQRFKQALARDKTAMAAIREAAARDQIGLTGAQAEAMAADLKKSGYKLQRGGSRTRFSLDGSRRTETLRYEGNGAGGNPETVVFRRIYDGANLARVEVERLNKATTALSRGTGGQKDFLTNTEHVTRWAASVGVLYTALGLSRRALTQFLELSYQIARLDQVYQKVGGSTRRLSDEVLRLAAANGRDAREALEAATAWSRLGLTRAQVYEATRVSLVAANVAELDSLEATKLLQSAMQAYGLRVRELSDWIGGLNYITNTFNATNAEVMTGISKTANVARQAKLPLQELTGLLSAAVGTTGQSGANLGNAFKSVILALSNPELQKVLRNDFRLEVTQGGEGADLKDMSTILSDLFVKYQQLSDLSRQKLLFDIGGKTQGSKLAGILDSYVRGLVLATNASVNLNSAEQENAKITSTLKAELAGVVTEFDRLIVQQGRIPAAGLSTAARTLKNSLALFNTPGVSTGLTVFLGLLAALGARLVITKIALDRLNEPGKRGYLGDSFDAMSRRVKVLSKELQDLAKSFGPVTGRLDAFLGSMGRGLTNTGRATARYGRTVGGVEGGVMRGLGTGQRMAGMAVQGVGMAGRLALGGALSAAALAPEILAGVAATAAITYGLNTAMEGIGRSSDAAERKLAGFNAELSEAEGKARAAATALKLLDTVARALPGSGTDSIARILDPLRDLQSLDGKGAMIPAALLGKLRADAAAGKTTPESVRTALKPVRDSLIAEQSRQNQRAYAAKTGELNAAREEVRRLESKWAPLRDDDLLKQQRAKVEELQGQRIGLRLMLEEGDAAEHISDVEERRLALLERHRNVLATIAQMMDSLAGPSPLDKLAAQVEAAKAEVTYFEARDAHLNQTIQTEEGRDSERGQQRVALFRQARDFRDKANEWQRAFSGQDLSAEVNVGSRMILPALANARAEYKRLIKQAEDAETSADALSRSPDSERARNERKGVQESLDKARADYAAKANDQSAAVAARYSRIQDIQADVNRDVEGSGVGTNEAEKLLDRRAAIMSRLVEIQTRLNAGGRDAVEVENDLVRKGQYLLQLAENREAVATRLVQNQKEQAQLAKDQEREYAKNIFNSGPAELLKRLAALRYHERGLDNSAGGRLAAGGLRPYLDELPGNSFEARRLRLEQTQLEAFTRNNPRNRPQERGERIANQGDLAGLMGPMFRQLAQFTTKTDQAASGVEAMAKSAAQANGQLVQFSANLAALNAQLRPAGGAPAAPRNPQAGGSGNGVLGR